MLVLLACLLARMLMCARLQPSMEAMIAEESVAILRYGCYYACMQAVHLVLRLVLG